MFDLTQLYSSNLELIGLLTGVINVILLTLSRWPRLQWWNWSFAIINAAVYLVLFIDWTLYGNAVLQVPFLVVNILGLWKWRGQLRGHIVSDVEEIPTTYASSKTFYTVFGLGVGGIILAYPLLAYIGDVSPLWDGWILTLSLAAAYLQLKKYVQSWWVWILVDVIAVPFHWYYGHEATALLYFVYGTICVYGLYEWNRDSKKETT